MSAADTGPLDFPVPIRLGDEIVGWASIDLAARLVGAGPPSAAIILALPRPAVLALRTGYGPGRRRFVTVDPQTITHLRSAGGIVTARSDTGEFWTTLPLAEVERRLDPRRFLRLDASTIVNLTRVVELVPWTHQRYRLLFGDAAKTELVLSRDVGRRLRAVLGW